MIVHARPHDAVGRQEWFDLKERILHPGEVVRERVDMVPQRELRSEEVHALSRLDSTKEATSRLHWTSKSSTKCRSVSITEAHTGVQGET